MKHLVRRFIPLGRAPNTCGKLLYNAHPQSFGLTILKKIISVVLLIVAIVIWLAPIAMLPGFFIGGSATPAPSSWEDTSTIDEVRLKVGGVIPRVVIIWIVQVDGELYVTGARIADG